MKNAAQDALRESWAALVLSLQALLILKPTVFSVYNRLIR